MEEVAGKKGFKGGERKDGKSFKLGVYTGWRERGKKKADLRNMLSPQKPKGKIGKWWEDEDIKRGGSIMGREENLAMRRDSRGEERLP